MASLSGCSVANVDAIEILLRDSCKCAVLITGNLMLRECSAVLADSGSVYIPYTEGICVHCR